MFIMYFLLVGGVRNWEIKVCTQTSRSRSISSEVKSATR